MQYAESGRARDANEIEPIEETGNVVRFVCNTFRCLKFGIIFKPMTLPDQCNRYDFFNKKLYDSNFLHHQLAINERTMKSFNCVTNDSITTSKKITQS